MASSRTEIERVVIAQLKTLFSDKALLSAWLQHVTGTAGLTVALHKAEGFVHDLADPTSSARLREIVHLALKRIELIGDRVRLVINKDVTVNWLSGATARDADSASDGPADTHIIDLPLAIRKRGVEQRLVIEGQRSSPLHIDQPLIDAIARANVYLAALADGQTRSAIATRYSVHPEDISRLLRLAFLSPSIVDLILTGRQPADLSVRDLTRRIDLPHDWAEQHRLLAI